MVSWFKRPGDSKLPQCKEDLLRWYQLTFSHSEQEYNCLKEGEPAIEDVAAHQGDISVVPEVLAVGGELDAVEALSQI